MPLTEVYKHITGLLGNNSTFQCWEFAEKDDISCDNELKMAGVICFREIHLGNRDIITPETFRLHNNVQKFLCDRNTVGGGMVILPHARHGPTIPKLDN